MMSPATMSDKERYEIARKIQDRFCELENEGYSFHGDFLSHGVADKVKRRFSKNSEKQTEFNPVVFVDEIPVDIVIPVYGPSESLNECIRSIENSAGIVPGVTLVDNGSDPLAMKLAQEFTCITSTITNNENRGFGGACDQGIRASTSDVVVILNSDACVEPDALRILVDEIMTNPHLGICAATCLFTDGTIQEAGRVLNSSGHSFGLYENSKVDLGAKRLLNVLYASFVCAAIRKDSYENVGGFDPEFSPAYSEDVDLSLRLWQGGKATAVSYAAKATHALGESSASLSDLEAIKERNRKYLVSKHAQYFSSLPTIDNPAKYPHEFSLARTKHLKSRVLVVCEKMPPVDEILEALNVDVASLVENEISIVCLDGENDTFTNPVKHFDVYNLKSVALHHWLRERICLFDDIHVWPSVGAKSFGEELSLLLLTQPYSHWKYFSQEGS